MLWVRGGALVLLAVADCGPGPTLPGSPGAPPLAAVTPPVERLLGTQPVSSCGDPAPSPEPDLMEATQLVASGNHACARVSSGRLRCWGSNATGQLASCEPMDASEVPMAFPGITQATAVSVGRLGTCAIDALGGLFCSASIRTLLGAEGPGPIEGVYGATSVAVGDVHVCAVLSSDDVVCFGHWDADEALGSHAEVVDSETDNGRGAGLMGLRGTRQLVAGSLHNCAVDGQGQVMCWGQNAHGQLGDPSRGTQLEQNRGVPNRVPGLPYIASLSASGHATCALSDVGELFCWGEGFGAKPLQVGLPPFQNVALGSGFLCGVTQAGGVTCGGEALDFAVPGTAASLPGFEDIEEVAVGDGFVCGRRRDGMVLCQGANDRGQLGGQHRGEASVLSPVKVLLGGVAI